jgi:hypothetical protein
MSRDWKPWTIEEVEDLVTREMGELAGEARALWSQIRVRPEPTRTPSGCGSDGRSHWAVARRGDAVLYWDSIEQEFGTGREQGGVITGAGTYGEKLVWALEALSKRA